MGQSRGGTAAGVGVAAAPGRGLVVDDEPMIREVFEAILATCGHEVLLAEDVDSAMAHVTEGGVEFIVSDFSMPGRTGLDLLRLVRGLSLDIPFLIVTGAPSAAGMAAADQLGVTRYLSKPVSARALREEVAGALVRHRSGVPFGRDLTGAP